MLPIDVPTLESLEFVLQYAKSQARLLEVGCGEGDLAAAMSKAGLNVHAIDRSDEAIAVAKSKGVNAVCADILTYAEEPFDVVLFTRSLHHIQPLQLAINQAHKLLDSGGILLIEDFVPEIVNQDAISWLHETQSRIGRTAFCSHCERGHIKISTVDQWREHHFVKHEVATGASLKEAVSAKFPPVKIEMVPYLYRYAVDNIKAHEDGGELARKILLEETELIAKGKIPAVGIRIVARQ